MALFHYTNIETLKKILESKALLATDLRSVNDTSEIVHGLKLMLQHLRRWRGELPRFDAERRAVYEPRCEERIGQLQAALESPPQVFVACFSTKGDDLCQWRGYTETGKGVCIGFHEERLLKMAKAEPFTLAPCDYIHELGSTPHKLADGNLLAELTPVRPGKHSDRSIRIMVARAKDLAFAGENEVRLIHVGDGTLAPFSLQSNGPLRVKFNLAGDPDLGIESLRVCPSPNAETTVEAVEQYMFSLGMYSIRASPSLIPYRPAPVRSAAKPASSS